MNRIATAALMLLALPCVLAAQAPNAHASDIAKARVAAAMAHRATHLRGRVIGPDNEPMTPATRAVPATRATPATPASGGAGRATPATPATPAIPASPAGSHRPSNPGQSGSHRP